MFGQLRRAWFFLFGGGSAPAPTPASGEIVSFTLYIQQADAWRAPIASVLSLATPIARAELMVATLRRSDAFVLTIDADDAWAAAR